MKTRYVNAQVYRGGRFAAGSLLVEDGRMAADTPGTTADRTVDPVSYTPLTLPTTPYG